MAISPGGDAAFSSQKSSLSESPRTKKYPLTEEEIFYMNCRAAYLTVFKSSLENIISKDQLYLGKKKKVFCLICWKLIKSERLELELCCQIIPILVVWAMELLHYAIMLFYIVTYCRIFKIKLSMFMQDRIVLLNLSITCFQIFLNSHFGTERFIIELKHFWHLNSYSEFDLY